MSDFKIKKINTDKDCEIVLEVEIKSKAIEDNKKTALERLNQNVKIDGFRPGHIPEKVLLEKVGDYSITEEACRIALDTNFVNIIQESKHFPINQPNITITKITPGADAEIKIEFAVSPIIDLSDYKKIAEKHNTEKEKESKEEVTDKEIDDVIINLQNEVAHFEYHQNNPDDHGHNHGELILPEVNDEFAKKVGPFENVDALKNAIKENISQGKNQKEIEKSRIKLIDEVIEKSKIKYPEFLLKSEQAIMIEEVKADIKQMGQSFEEYLKHIDKTEEVLKEEKREMADKRVKTQLVLSKIANQEKLKADEEKVNVQVDQILKTHVGAERENVKMFVERFELNQLVWKMLEEVK